MQGIPLPIGVQGRALIGVITISFSAIYVKLSSASPVTAGFFRAAYALPILWLMWVSRRRLVPPRSRSSRVFALLAGLVLGCNFALWHTSIRFIGAGLATTLGNVQVVLVGLAAWPLFGERLTRRSFGAALIVFTGVVLVSGLGASDAYGENPGLGAILGLAAGVNYTIFLLVYKRATVSQQTPVGALLDASAGAAVAALLVGPIADRGFSLVPSWPGHGWLIAVAIGSQVIGWLLITEAFSKISSLGVSMLLILQPALAVLWGRLIFGEVLAVIQWIGFVLVLTGIGLFGREAPRPLAAPGITGPQP